MGKFNAGDDDDWMAEDPVPQIAVYVTDVVPEVPRLMVSPASAGVIGFDSEAEAPAPVTVTL